MMASRMAEHLRSYTVLRPEFTARAPWRGLVEWERGALYIEPGSTWESGYVESFNGKLSD